MLCKLKSRMSINLMCAIFLHFFLFIHYCVHVCTRKVWLLELYSLATSPKVYPQVHPHLYSKGFLKKPLFFPSHIFIIDESFENLNFERCFTFRPFLVLFKGKWIGKFKSWSWYASYSPFYQTKLSRWKTTFILQIYVKGEPL